MDKIEKIKEWVKKQKKESLARNSIGVITGKAIFVDANELLSFLDTLSEEPNKTFEDYLKASPSERRKMNMTEILGEERLAKTKEQMSLEEEYKNYVENDPVYSKLVNGIAGRSIARHFAEWQKQQMFKDAVEGEVYLYHSYNRDATAILVDIPKENLGDKVRIVVLKEEEE